MSYFLICDLDDCLVKTDTLYEQWLVLLKNKPTLFLLSFFWLLRGKAFFKSKLAQNTSFNPALLPYRDDVLNFIKTKKGQAQAVILASASPRQWVESVSNYLGLFDDVIGTTESKNLKGTNKLVAIREKIHDSDFIYIGDHEVDLKVWTDAFGIVAVNPSTSLKKSITALKKETTYIFDVQRNHWRLLLKQIRPHQWVKNLLVFLPAIAGHKLLAPEVLSHCLIAFAGFSFSASFVYVLNDLLDLKSDRNHHSKRSRPFASGDLSIKWGIFLLPFLLVLVSSLSLLLPVKFSFWILTYLILNLAYSLYLKQSVVVDIIILAMMYTLRIFAGSAAAEVPVSEWLLSFSILFFFSLACVKRYTEIIRSKNKITLDGRGYRQVDHSMVQSLGVGSGLLSVLIILLYLQSNDVRALYEHANNLWFATPVLLFWISRIWILTNRDEIHDDPVVFAVKDRVSWLCLAILGIIFGISS